MCRRCGISRPTLCKWWRRYQALGQEGLASQSRRPNNSPNQKVHEEQKKWILELRQERNLGARRIQHELKRMHNISLSLATIHKVLKAENVPSLRKVPRRKRVKRYQKEIPGEQVQMDTCQIKPGLVQFTVIDDCTRFVIAGLYNKKTAVNTVDFLERVIEEAPFPIQRVRTDRGREFTAYDVQDRLLEWGIKFRPNRPAAPHLNGKVERIQQTMLQEFYPTVDLENEDLDFKLDEWLFYYNWHRKHSAINETPIEKCCRLTQITPIWEEIELLFDEAAEKARRQSFGRGSKGYGLKNG